MKCYICEKEAHVGGTRYSIAEAVGICHNCGIAICLDHSRKTKEPGSPLLCPSCAEKNAMPSYSQAEPTLAHSKD